MKRLMLAAVLVLAASVAVAQGLQPVEVTATRIGQSTDLGRAATDAWSSRTATRYREALQISDSSVLDYEVVLLGSEAITRMRPEEMPAFFSQAMGRFAPIASGQAQGPFAPASTARGSLFTQSILTPADACIAFMQQWPGPTPDTASASLAGVVCRSDLSGQDPYSYVVGVLVPQMIGAAG